MSRCSGLQTWKRAVRSLLASGRGTSRRYLYESSHEDSLDNDNEFILSILRSSPSTRDSRAYLTSFAPPRAPPPQPSEKLSSIPKKSDPTAPPPAAVSVLDADIQKKLKEILPQLAQTTAALAKDNHLVASLLNPTVQRPALVKIQGPFSETQLNSICRGMAHLQKLGLVSVIVVDRDDLPVLPSSDHAVAQRQRTLALRDVERVVAALGRHRAAARPVLSTVARIAGPLEEGGMVGEGREEGEVFVEGEGLDHIRRAVEEGEIPVLLPVALDPGCRSQRVGADQVLIALAEAMSTYPTTSTSRASSSQHVQAVPTHAAAPPDASNPSASPVSAPETLETLSALIPRADLTPMRLLIINREGGIPSYARQGLPHLSINLTSEYQYINDTFLPQWKSSNPTALDNLQLASDCLNHMPRDASALIVSHRSPAAMIANLITNKPAHSASLPHALLVESEGRITRDTPTLVRKGLPVKVLRSMDEVELPKLTALLEKSFRRVLHQSAFYDRMRHDLDFVIVIGDYAGAAVVTKETDGTRDGICYLDKFAVLPSHQGDGTVDFLWVALRDETYGLGLLDAANPSEGSLSGRGRGKDLVWRSRADNPVNKWYFERSNGFTTTPDGKWKMFWCDAEQRLRETAKQEGREFGGGRLVRVVEDEERGRLERWAPVIAGIKSAWSA